MPSSEFWWFRIMTPQLNFIMNERTVDLKGRRVTALWTINPLRLPSTPNEILFLLKIIFQARQYFLMQVGRQESLFKSRPNLQPIPIHRSDLNDKLGSQTPRERYHHYVPINYSYISPISSYIFLYYNISITFSVECYSVRCVGFASFIVVTGSSAFDDIMILSTLSMWPCYH